MNIESGFSQVAQSLLWPVLVLVWLAGRVLGGDASKG